MKNVEIQSSKTELEGRDSLKVRTTFSQTINLPSVLCTSYRPISNAFLCLKNEVYMRHDQSLAEGRATIYVYFVLPLQEFRKIKVSYTERLSSSRTKGIHQNRSPRTLAKKKKNSSREGKTKETVPLQQLCLLVRLYGSAPSSATAAAGGAATITPAAKTTQSGTVTTVWHSSDSSILLNPLNNELCPPPNGFGPCP